MGLSEDLNSLSANDLHAFAIAFQVLQLRARCLYLRSVFYLKMLALLQGEALRYGGIAALLV
jgi:hypothetical protein